MYNNIHAHIINNGVIDGLNLKKIADDTGMKIEYVRLLYNLGYFERDIQTYSRAPSKRQELAKGFEHQLELLKERSRITTYGGTIYSKS